MRYLLIIILFFFVSCAATGQSGTPSDKRPLDHSDFDQWRSISNPEFTRDGGFLVYALNPQEGDGELVVRNLSTNSDTSLERGRNFQLNYDGTHLAYFISPTYADQRQARIDGKRPSSVFDDTLAVFILSSGDLEKIAEVTSFKMPEKSGEWLAFLYDRELNDAEENEEPEEDRASAQQDDVSNGVIETENDLVVRNLRNGTEIVINYVENYYFSKHGERLIFTTAPDDTLQQNGVYVLDLASGKRMNISSGLENYRSVTMDSTGSQVAFLAMPAKADDNDESDEESENGNGNGNNYDDDAPDYYGLYYWAMGQDQARLIADQESEWLTDSWMINEHSRPSFSYDGSRLLFGTAPEPMRRDRSVEEIDMADVDVWSWTDERLQTQQLVQLNQDRRNTYRAVYHISDERFVQLEDREMENISIPNRNNADFAIGTQNRHYLHLTQWAGFPALTDIYTVDVSTGERTLFAERVKASSSFSPDGNYFIWYDYADQNWHTLHLASGEVRNLTGHLDVPFYNELHDSPSDPGPLGIEGWTEGDEHVIIRDFFDLWVFDPSQENGGRLLTGGYGRDNNIILRSFNPDRESRYFSSDEVYLSAFYDEDKSSGFYRTIFSADESPNQLWRDAYRAFTPVKADDSDQWMVRKSTFQKYQDIYLTDRNFSRFNQITEANPQQSDYLWGDVQLFRFNTLDGEEMDGLLYLPENFDPEREYPMIVYFYERTSNRKHWYRAPAPSASTITPAFYTSRGYIVAMPDIVYREGLPGRSAEDAVIGMTLHLLDRGFVARDRIALQGQSWGGYQIAHIITRTDMFAAAMAGAPVVNMISAYGGIRWASGLNRQFQYEQTQSRIGGTLWERQQYYIENSPIFFADRVSTPLLMMHNDEDGAVPWYQGIEFFTALKRLDQPVWMLNYNGEAHNLRDRVNRKDLSVRMQQFFDHYLMDAPMPVWMKYGVPAVEKGLHQGFELVE